MNRPAKDILIIQTAFIGDVILALPVAQVLDEQFPDDRVHFVVRKGNETLLENHPSVDQVWVWEKEDQKKRSLFHLISRLRKRHWKYILNLHRFFSSGTMMSLLSADQKIGFDKNPLAYFYDHQVEHHIPYQTNGHYLHEVERNLKLLAPIGVMPDKKVRPRLYPSQADQDKVAAYQEEEYLVIAPASVWETKQWPQSKWERLLRQLPQQLPVYLIGGAEDREFCANITDAHPNSTNCCGDLTLLQSAALIQKANALVTNDSAPLHLASAVNTPTISIFCSTVPEFGFGPLADHSKVIEYPHKLYCRPCGLHGHDECPEEHFQCATEIAVEQVYQAIENQL